MSIGGWLRRLWIAGMVLAAACGGGPEAPAPAAEAPMFKPIDPSQVTGLFDTPGMSRYLGILPCADCSGIRTELMLLQDPATGEPQIYELVETHVGSMSTEGEKPVTRRGKWSITRGTPADPAATVYRLDGGGDAARSFERVSEQELRQLDGEGRRIASDLNYSLMRLSDRPVLAFPAPAGQSPAPAASGGIPPAAMVTDMASGWPVTLRVGQRMTARLAADRAAGARWSLRAGSDGGVIAVEGEPSYEAPSGGGPGIEVFRLEATRPGTTTLTFDYGKGAGTPASRTVSYPVTVQ